MVFTPEQFTELSPIFINKASPLPIHDGQNSTPPPVSNKPLHVKYSAPRVCQTLRQRLTGILPRERGGGATFAFEPSNDFKPSIDKNMVDFCRWGGFPPALSQVETGLYANVYLYIMKLHIVYDII